ncbi:MAG TPA: adenosylmethionine--8-amino-7-oxononanoate transaminase, partial [Alphaproteobacteria bacterium]|nr:adenosylmethionine--8-amino-7-oxononanoate transaminase [Alphaproteobacteria bacterium]
VYVRGVTNSSSLWHPFTQHALAGAPLFIERAEGAALYTRDGQRIIDAISSWWVNTHGHNHPAIVKAVKEQAEKLDQVIFAGFTHAPAEEMAAKLRQMMPPALTHVFLSDSGSTAVEVALKMAIGAQAHRGKARGRIVALEHGYHGDTFGAMAAGAPSVFNQLYAPYLFSVERLPFPASGREQQTIDAFKKLLREEDVAALIIEPLLLGAGGMLMYSPQVLKELKQACEQGGIYFIADEVLTGFGRTGTLLACEQGGVVPDILCLSKGLTGGFLPLGATLCSEEIYQAFYSQDRMKTFWHSSSYTGNPLCCAAAVASLTLWEDTATRQQLQKLCALQEQQAQKLNARRCGTVVALDIERDDAGYLSQIGPALYDYFISRGVLLRPLGNTLYVMPPYCISDDDLKNVYTVLHDALGALRRGNLERAA